MSDNNKPNKRVMFTDDFWSQPDIPDNVDGLLEDLFRYYGFDIGEEDAGEYPIDTVWSGGSFHSGAISEELYTILLELYQEWLFSKQED